MNQNTGNGIRHDENQDNEISEPMIIISDMQWEEIRKADYPIDGRFLNTSLLSPRICTVCVAKNASPAKPKLTSRLRFWLSGSISH
jgi:hypothetical protein